MEDKGGVAVEDAAAAAVVVVVVVVVVDDNAGVEERLFPLFPPPIRESPVFVFVVMMTGL